MNNLLWINAQLRILFTHSLHAFERSLLNVQHPDIQVKGVCSNLKRVCAAFSTVQNIYDPEDKKE